MKLGELMGLGGMNEIGFEDVSEEFGKCYKLLLIGKGYSGWNRKDNVCWVEGLVYMGVERGVVKLNGLEDVGYEKKG